MRAHTDNVTIYVLAHLANTLRLLSLSLSLSPSPSPSITYIQQSHTLSYMDNFISMQYFRKGVHPLASELQQNLLGYTGDAQRSDYREVSM